MVSIQKICQPHQWMAQISRADAGSVAPKALQLFGEGPPDLGLHFQRHVIAMVKLCFGRISRVRSDLFNVFQLVEESSHLSPLHHAVRDLQPRAVLLGVVGQRTGKSTQTFSAIFGRPWRPGFASFAGRGTKLAVRSCSGTRSAVVQDLQVEENGIGQNIHFGNQLALGVTLTLEPLHALVHRQILHTLPQGVLMRLLGNQPRLVVAEQGRGRLGPSPDRRGRLFPMPAELSGFGSGGGFGAPT
mmetsp:Transcript_84319/g.133602  ORF Transcript_84319/g.133602 Transcript_84319/m.133602 type:complete len:244 (-) Transcript_84319:342-1073(-)